MALSYTKYQCGIIIPLTEKKLIRVLALNGLIGALELDVCFRCSSFHSSNF